MTRTKIAALAVATASALSVAGAASACPPAWFASHPTELSRLQQSASQQRQLQVVKSARSAVQMRTYFGAVRIAG